MLGPAGLAVIIGLAVLLVGTPALAEEPFGVTPGESVAGRLLSTTNRHCIHLALPAGARLKAKLRRGDDEDLAVLLSLRGPDCSPFNVTEWLSAKSDRISCPGLKTTNAGILGFSRNARASAPAQPASRIFCAI